MTILRTRETSRPTPLPEGALDELRGLFLTDVRRETERPPQSPFDPDLGAHLFVSEPPPEPLKADPGPLDSLPRIGTILDKYRIEEVLGTGGFGVVYRATHLLLQRPVALKLLRAKVLAQKPGLAELLCEEARFAAKVSHPNVVHVFDVTHTHEITYLVMEYVEGRTLAQTLKRDGRLDPEAVVAIGLDVAAGLAAAHERGLIHRDIKPQNILLAKNGPAKILDLGLARSMTEPRGWGGGRSPDRAAVVGTIGYMAPEQFDRPEDVDFRADIYSLGVTLYQAATGVPPFPTDDPATCLDMHRSSPVPAPDGIVSSLPSPLSYLLRWMLAKAPAKRPASYELLTDALRKTRDAIATKRGNPTLSHPSEPS